MVVTLDVGHACKLRPVAIALADADDRVRLPAGLVFAHEDDVADLDFGCGNLDGIEEIAQAQGLGHGLVEASQHLVEVVFALLAGLRDIVPSVHIPVLVVGDLPAADDLPAVDDVDAVVSLVAEVLEAVDAHARRAAEEVAHHLRDPRPAVVVGARGTVPLQLAVPKQRLHRVATAVPVEVQRQLLVRCRDDCPVSHGLASLV